MQTPKSYDEAFLRLNSWMQMVGEDGIKAAQLARAQELRDGKPARPLADVLRAQGALSDSHWDLVRSLADSLQHEAGPATPSGSTVEFVGGRPPGPAPASPASSPSNRPSSPSARPPEVDEAARDLRNCVAHYVLLEMAGRGGMGTVYRAWDDSVGRIVALKILLESSTDAVERFLREAHMAARLRHPAIATVFEVGEVNGRHFIAMEFIDGEAAGRRPLSVERTLEVVRDAARALQHAHDQKIVHRDIKPGNLMIDRKGAVFLTDFGLAKEVNPASTRQLTMTGTVVGTLDYMSPEQARGETRAIDYRSDLYSLGATLYRLLAGRPAHRIDNAMDALRIIEDTKPAPLRSINSAISPELEAVVWKAMAKDPRDRFPSASALADEIDRLLREKRFLGGYGLVKYLARRWVPLAVAGILVAAGLRIGLDVFTAGPPEGMRFDPVEVTRAATISLGAVEERLRALPPEERKSRLHRDVLSRFDTVLRRQPKFLPARVGRVRALYLDGNLGGASEELLGLADEWRRDYRIPFLRALIALESAWGRPPLPALDAPGPDWHEPPAAWPASVAEDLRVALGAKTEKAGIADFARDGPGAHALLALMESQFEEATHALGDLSSRQAIPLYARAWCRAAYLARRFADVRASPVSAGRRERLGAGMALAGSIRSLEAVLPEAADDPEAAVLLRTALARRTLEAGRDPEEHVKAGIALGPPDEFAGVLRSFRLRRNALAGADEDSTADEALRLLGVAPRSWTGQLAAIEVRISRGVRELRRGGQARPWLEEAVARANALSQESPGWSPPRFLRAAAFLRLGRPHEALGELATLSDARAPLLAGAVRLFLVEERRRSGLAVRNELEECLKDAAAGLAALPDHPEALNLQAAASLALAEETGDVRLLDEAMAQLDRALSQVPGYVDALLHRGQARFLRAQAGLARGADPRDLYARATADLDEALAAAPGLSPARWTRGVLRFTSGQYEKALEDWKTLAPDERLKEWIRLAEARIR